MRITSHTKKGRDAQRAVDACMLAMERGRVTPAHVKNVLECEGVDLKPFTQFLYDNHNPFLRKMVAPIVARCEPEKLIEKAHEEVEELMVLSAICQALTEVQYKEVEPLMPILRGENMFASETILRFFVGVGRADLLFPLVFDNDPGLVERVKRYLHEQGLL